MWKLANGAKQALSSIFKSWLLNIYQQHFILKLYSYTNFPLIIIFICILYPAFYCHLLCIFSFRCVHQNSIQWVFLLLQSDYLSFSSSTLFICFQCAPNIAQDILILKEVLVVDHKFKFNWGFYILFAKAGNPIFLLFVNFTINKKVPDHTNSY